MFSRDSVDDTPEKIIKYVVIKEKNQAEYSWKLTEDITDKDLVRLVDNFTETDETVPTTEVNVNYKH